MFEDSFICGGGGRKCPYRGSGELCNGSQTTMTGDQLVEFCLYLSNSRRWNLISRSSIPLAAASTSWWERAPASLPSAFCMTAPGSSLSLGVLLPPTTQLCRDIRRNIRPSVLMRGLAWAGSGGAPLLLFTLLMCVVSHDDVSCQGIREWHQCTAWPMILI